MTSLWPVFVVAVFLRAGMMAFYCFHTTVMLSCWAILSIPQQGNFSSLGEVEVRGWRSGDLGVPPLQLQLWREKVQHGQHKQGRTYWHVLCLGFSPLPVNWNRPILLTCVKSCSGQSYPAFHFQSLTNWYLCVKGPCYHSQIWHWFKKTQK